MGMFDYVTCQYPLEPLIANTFEFQTKDTPAQYLDRYKIDADGKLWHQLYDVVDRSDHNAKGWRRMVGLMTRINEHWERDEFTGEIRFYGGPGKDWYEYSAYFVRGQLKHMETVQVRACPQSY